MLSGPLFITAAATFSRSMYGTNIRLIVCLFWLFFVSFSSKVKMMKVEDGRKEKEEGKRNGIFMDRRICFSKKSH